MGPAGSRRAAGRGKGKSEHAQRLRGGRGRKGTVRARTRGPPEAAGGGGGSSSVSSRRVGRLAAGAAEAAAASSESRVSSSSGGDELDSLGGCT